VDRKEDHPEQSTRERSRRGRSNRGAKIGGSAGWSASGAVRTPGGRPGSHRVPLVPTPLIGRESEVAAILQQLRRPEVRLLTLLGPGGVGKTRLAIEVARRLADEDAGKVWFFDLSPVREASHVVVTIAEAMAVREVAGRSLLLGLIEALGSRQWVLVLDNFEQVQAAATSLGTILALCPNVTLLVTSRAALRLRAEHAWPVSPLPLPDATADPRRLVDAPSVALFVERARAVSPEFQLTADNAAAVAEICVYLEGLPLAIELAAVRMRFLTPAAILLRLKRDGVARLATQDHEEGPRDLPLRHRTLQQTIVWSYDLLTAAQQTLFRRLGVFRGSFPLEAVEGMLADTSGLDDLAALVDQSLLSRLPEALSGGQPRYRMLQTVREFALDCLEASGESEAIRQKHAEFYSSLAELAEDALIGPEQVQWQERLDRDYENFRAALRWAVDRRDAGLGFQLTWGLWRFWSTRVWLTEARAWLNEVLALGWRAEQAALRMKGLWAAGRIFFEVGDYPTAVARFSESLQLARQIRNRAGEANALTQLGHLGVALGNDQTAQELYLRSLEIRRQNAGPREVGISLLGLGDVARRQGDLTAAREYLEQAITLFRLVGDQAQTASALGHFAELKLDLNLVGPAEQLIIESLSLFRTLDDRQGIARSLERATRLAVAQRQFARALRLAEAAESLRISLGTPLSAREQERWQAVLDAARRALGADNVRPSVAPLAPAEAIALALGNLPTPPPPAAENSIANVPLTSRQREVAGLVARGLTNQQIADALVISGRTAETHVQQILTKLNFASRSQLAVWAVHHGLTAG